MRSDLSTPLGGAAMLRRRMVERVLTHCETDSHAAEPLLILLRRFANESAREEARMFCDELMADEAIAPLQLRADRGVIASNARHLDLAAEVPRVFEPDARMLAQSIPRHDARREDRFEMLGPVAIGVSEIFVGDAAQLPAQFAGHARGVGLGAFAHDGLNGVDVMRDQVGRHFVEIGRVLDDPAQAFGGGAGGGKSEGGGVALDVMGGAKQLFAREVGEAVLEDGGMGRRQPVGFDAIQFLNSPDRPASAFSARATGSSRSFSATRRNTLRSGLGCVMT